eukprot:snap_masked-scaffold_38-processed-gene-0.5-mRNA-1 protein AED:1.00 eAED:1.00 QI:0/0/0/0/1/1/2/0/73
MSFRRIFLLNEEIIVEKYESKSKLLHVDVFSFQHNTLLSQKSEWSKTPGKHVNSIIKLGNFCSSSECMLYYLY